MFDRRTLQQSLAIFILAAIAGSVSNATADKGRRLKWLADWSGVPSAAPVSASPSATAEAGASGPAAVTPAADVAAPAPFEIQLDRALAAHQAGALFLDARRTEEYSEGHIAGARSFAVWESDVDDKIVTLMSEFPTTTQVVCYCNGGKCEDSHTLRNKLLAAGYDDVLVYLDGFPDWRDHGHPVEK